MVQNPPYWRVKECDKTPLGNVNKEKHHTFLVTCVLFWSLAHSFAFQYDVSYTM